MEEGALSRVYAAMDAHAGKASLQTAAVTMLWNVSEHDASRAAIVASGGFRRVLAVMDHFMTNVDTQIACCGAIMNLTAKSSQQVVHEYLTFMLTILCRCLRSI